MTGTILWYASRSAGVVSLVLLTAVVVLGILTAGRSRGRVLTPGLAVGLHRNLSLLSLVFLAVHIVTAVADPFTSLGWVAAAVPFSVAYHRFWLGLGAVALELIGALTVTSVLRRFIGLGLWRGVHVLSYAAWVIALFHGYGSGSDGHSLLLLGIDLAAVSAVLAALLTRLQGLAAELGGRGPDGGDLGRRRRELE